MMGMDVIYTDNADQLKSCKSPCINYSKDDLGNGIWIIPSGLIEEKGLRHFEPPVSAWHDMQVLFPASGDIQFDLFSAVFYLVSRYEEYLPFRPDVHGRFPSTQCFLHKKGLLEKPLVNQWLKELISLLRIRYSTAIPPLPFIHIPTLDIDIAYRYRCRGPFRAFAGMVRSILTLHFCDFFRRVKVLAGISKDPFDVYDDLKKMYSALPVKPRVFILAGDWGMHDKNIPYTNTAFRNLIKELDSIAVTGVHPSYTSYNNNAKVVEEKRRIEEITDHPVKISRQHFLLLSFPETYRTLLRNGITEDYTLGFADVPGFRAGIAHPFYLYDLKSEERTTLKIFPLVIMDRTFIRYLGISPEEAWQRIEKMIIQVKESGGTLVSLFHNDIIADKRWRGLFERVLKV